jgi:hypothetical protein
VIPELDWHVDRFEETTKPIPINILKEIEPEPKPEFVFSLIWDGVFPVGVWIKGNIPL